MIEVVLLFVFVFFIFGVYYAIRFYKYNMVPRYVNKYGFDLYPFEVDFLSPNVEYYYGDFSRGLMRDDIWTFDANGVFVYKKNENEVYYHPSAIAQYIIVKIDEYYRNKDEELHKTIRNNLVWLLQSENNESQDKSVWYLDFDTFFVNNTKPYASAFTQANIISALIRCAKLYDNASLIAISENTFRYMDTEVENGGLKNSKEFYGFWYEEYLASRGVVNGHVFSLLAIWDLYRVTQKRVYYNRFFEGVESIKKNISQIDLGFYTKYALSSPNPANNSYNYTHVSLFQIMFEITGDSFFEIHRKKFEAYNYSILFKFYNCLYLIKLSIFQKLLK